MGTGATMERECRQAKPVRPGCCCTHLPAAALHRLFGWGPVQTACDASVLAVQADHRHPSAAAAVRGAPAAAVAARRCAAHRMHALQQPGGCRHHPEVSCLPLCDLTTANRGEPSSARLRIITSACSTASPRRCALPRLAAPSKQTVQRCGMKFCSCMTCLCTSCAGLHIGTSASF